MLDKEEKVDYGKTLNLPQTEFQMKAGLPQKEPELLKYWEDNKIYEKSLENREKKFLLHDGPPYANGDIHIGHALNKILKDIILKYKRLRGYYSPYVPGWDTHGLPIELKVNELLGDKVKDMDKLDIIEECKKYAMKYVGIQKEGFKRLGIFGDWENPYITLKPEYEAKQLEVFGKLYENGYIFKGLKPIYWSPATETALAEAEIEYHDHKSPSIYVKFEAKDEIKDKFNIELKDGEKLYCVIWTTTPWTLPGNVAISLHPEFDYVFARTEKGILIMAEGLLEKAFKDIGIENYEIIKTVKGAELENLKCLHPFIDRESLIILGEHVTLEAGTGCVHTAPGHGQDDYVVGTRYRLPILSPIDHKGVLTEEAGQFAGLFYKKANKEIVDYLTETGHLLNVREISHSYPHDWRSKTPVIFRATEQWFVKCEGSDLRENALKALDDVKFVPDWGRNRITSMLESRPDWCISRQRVWGVPIPVFYNEKNGKEIFTQEILERVIEKVKVEGSAAWFKYSPVELIGQDMLDKLGLKNEEIRKETNIMDVWFDSGSSHKAVLDVYEELYSPADMYLEGSDQHRGWFQTSLLTAVGVDGKAPYKELLTHGFVNDGKGMKMSKSAGNVVRPQEVIEKYGADILRLWCASVDYRDDVKISDNIMKQMTESYRRLRNTARYILGNINDFDPKKDRVEYNELMEMDKWAMHKLEKLKRKVNENYEKYEFYNLFYDIHYFAAVDMSAFYLDILKDRLYTSKKDSKERRAAQTVMTDILIAFTKMMTPVLSFTAEEIWQMLPEAVKESESVLTADWYEENDIYINEEIAIKWDKIIKMRDAVNKSLEEARKDKTIGHSLNAEVIIYNEEKSEIEFINNNKELLEDVFIVSKLTATLEKTGEESSEVKGMYVKIEKAPGEKCERCWKYSENLGTNEEYPDICPRCTSVLTK